MANVYTTTNWRLVRPKGMTDAVWKAFRRVHGKASGEGTYIFGDPPGTGALQDAANDPSMSSHVDGQHVVNWKNDDTVAKSVRKYRGDLTGKDVAKADKKLFKKLGYKTPAQIRRFLQKTYYLVQYGPDGRAK